MDYYQLQLERKETIENGLLELLKSVPLSQITVKMLAEHLGMSRKCFYHYFSGKEACLESLMDRTIQEGALYVAVTPSDADVSLQPYILNLEFWKEHRHLLEAITQNELNGIFISRCMAHHLREDKTLHVQMGTSDVEFDEDILLFLFSGQISLLMRWCQRDFEPSVEEMARKYKRLRQMPLIQRTEE